MTFPQSSLPISDGDENTEERDRFPGQSLEDLIKLTHSSSFPLAR
jgi:hypothetical protein